MSSCTIMNGPGHPVTRYISLILVCFGGYFEMFFKKYFPNFFPFVIIFEKCGIINKGIINASVVTEHLPTFSIGQ